MKKVMVIALLATLGLFATDYTDYTAEELAAMRGSIPAEDQQAFSEALQSKLSELTPEERQAIMSKAQAGTQNGEQVRTRTQTRSRATDQKQTSDAMESISSYGGGNGHGGMNADSHGGGHGGGGGGGGGR